MNVSNRELLKQRSRKGVRLPRLKHNARRQQRKLLKSNDERSASKHQERIGELQGKGRSKERLVNENAKRKDAVDVAAAVEVVFVSQTHAQEEG